MTENLALWDSWKTPPPEALKEIKGGRLKGKHDISPVWRMKTVTEALGPCGSGWKYTIDRLWMEAGPESGGEVAAFAQVSVSIVVDSGVWSDPIPGVGGSMFVAKESGGLYVSDEAYKMATTDAISVALKALGVAADVYMGAMDSKYARPAQGGQESGGGDGGGTSLGKFWGMLEEQFGKEPPWEDHYKRRMLSLIFGTTTIKDIKAMEPETIKTKLNAGWANALSVVKGEQAADAEGAE